MRYAIAQWTAVGALAARDRPRDADKLGPHFIRAEPNRRIAMSAHIDEFQMRRERGVRERTRTLAIERPRIFEARPDAVLQQHVVRPVGSRAVRAVGKVQRPQRQILTKRVL